MDKYIYDERNELWYELQGDYYIPCLELPAEKEQQPIGLWGQRHMRYLKEYRRAGAHGKAHGADETGTGYHGAAKGGKCLRMGAENE